jgi:chemotaxis protein methyltransferase CheR
VLKFSDSQFKKICQIMYEAAGLSFNDSKKALIESRLSLRVQKLGFSNYDDYIACLEDENEAVEFQMAVDMLTTNETYFFREPHHFDLVEETLTRRQQRTPIAVWSAASSFGDEAFSLAMLLSDLQILGRIGGDWSILATDISHRVLLSAKEAVYPQDRLRNVSPARLKNYCLRGHGPAEGQVMIQDKLRSRVQFGQLNLMRPFSEIGLFDFIFLRNVLIYFDAITKQELVDRILQHLKPDGVLFLGTAEGRVQCRTPIKSVVPGAFVKV